MSVEKEKVKIVKSVLAKQVKDGMKRAELAEYYNLSESQIAKALTACDLKIRKFHKPAFEIVEEEVSDWPTPNATLQEPLALEGTYEIFL